MAADPVFQIDSLFQNAGVRGIMDMAEDEKREFQDVLAEESSRGQKRPKKAVTLARERMIRRTAKLLADPNCDDETFLEAIREFGLPDESDEIQKLLALWRRRHGNR